MAPLRKKYSKQERLEIVQLSLAPESSVREIAAQFGINPNSLYRWRKLYYSQHQSPQHQSPSKGGLSPEQQQIKELQKQLREAQLERDILKKAVRIFSKSDTSFTDL